MRRLLLGFLSWLLLAGAASAQNANNTSIQVANNTTATVVSTRNSTVTGIDGFSNSTSAAWVKIYNSAAQTCGSGTPIYRGLIIGGTNGAGFISGPLTDTYTNGISVCVTVNYADSDTTAPAASTFVVNIHWK